MPRVPVPPEIDEFLRRPNPAVVATRGPRSEVHTAATWYGWDGTRILLAMDVDAHRLSRLRSDPRVSLTVYDGTSRERHATIEGRVVAFEDDDGLAATDRLAHRYMGGPYPARDARHVVAHVELERWHAWSGARPWPE